MLIQEYANIAHSAKYTKSSEMFATDMQTGFATSADSATQCFTTNISRGFLLSESLEEL